MRFDDDRGLFDDGLPGHDAGVPDEEVDLAGRSQIADAVADHEPAAVGADRIANDVGLPGGGGEMALVVGGVVGVGGAGPPAVGGQRIELGGNGPDPLMGDAEPGRELGHRLEEATGDDPRLGTDMVEGRDRGLGIGHRVTLVAGLDATDLGTGGAEQGETPAVHVLEGDVAVHGLVGQFGHRRLLVGVASELIDALDRRQGRVAVEHHDRMRSPAHTILNCRAVHQG